MATVEPPLSAASASELENRAADATPTTVMTASSPGCPPAASGIAANASAYATAATSRTRRLPRRSHSAPMGPVPTAISRSGSPISHPRSREV